MKRILVCLLAMSMGEMWSVQTSVIDTNLRGVSVVAGKLRGQNTTIWATGSNGIILRSTDSGKSWERLQIAEGNAMDFRGVQAFDQNNAYVMASGEGEKSRIYKTTDGGKKWELQYTDPRKEFFLDGIVCSSSTNCFALSDPVDGKFVLLRTQDGKHWKEMSNAGMPPALPKEGVFAASNSSLILYDKTELYFATGGPAARVFHTDDLGKSWTVAETPVLSGNAPQGIFSLARMGDTVVAVGGDYEKAAQRERVAAYSLDRGKTWKLATQIPNGYRSSVVALYPVFIAAGPNGSDMSGDGIEWVPAGKLGMNAMAVGGNKAWAVGAKGVVAESLQY
jgi:photosystem II stability/assembly factor-like uncharacterized protein